MATKRTVLSDFCVQIASGSTPSRTNPDFYGGSVPWLKTKELNQYKILDTEEHITSEALEKSACRIFPADSVVIAMYGATVGALSIIGSPMATNQACCVLKPDESKLHYKYLYYWLLHHRRSIVDMANGAAQQNLSVGTIKQLVVDFPPIETQNALADALGSLDDKIAANKAVIGKTLALQDALFEKVLPTTSSISLREVCEPILGGTPKRSDDEAWVGSNRWASVADMTSARNSHLISTAEHISDLAITTRRFAPLPAGGVLLSARGTVGHVVSVVFPTSFNQSAYGFVAPKGFEPALRLVIRGAVAELKSKSYGSVFSTITKDQINECQVPDIFNDSYAELNADLAALEKRIIAAELENETLARTRDELLPLLMSGRITVAGASKSGVGSGVEGMLEGMS